MFSNVQRAGGIAAAAFILMFTALPAHAAVTLIYDSADPLLNPTALPIPGTYNIDERFERQGGWLQQTYGLPNPASGNTVLPPIERAVGQVKTGTNKRRGLHVPTSGTGLPAPDGTGVTTPLTNVPGIGSSDTAFAKNTPVAFTMKREGTTLSYQVGTDPIWSQTKSYFADINAFELRIRPGDAGTGATHSITDIIFSDDITTNQSIGSLTGFDGPVRIQLWENVVGDFTLTGNYVFDWVGNTAPTGSRLASQIKLLATPRLITPPPVDPIPEPASWALLIAGFGLTGAAMRRRRSVAA